MFHKSVLLSYSPTMRFVMKAGATMKSTMPSASPQTIEMAISFLPNSGSGSFVLGVLLASLLFTTDSGASPSSSSA